MIIESTNPSTVKVPHQAKWVRFRENREPTEALVWIFTDGSIVDKGTMGGYGAVVLHEGEERSYSGKEALTSTRNVGSELNGLLMGLRNVPEGSELAIVSDYLGIAAWLSGNWKIKDSEVRRKINEAKKIANERNLTFARLIHHKGHQKDDSAFTRLNHRADRLAAGEL